MKKESINKLKADLDILVTKYDSLVRSGDFRESLNVIKNVDAVTQQLQLLNVEVLSKSLADNKYYEDDWYAILKFFIETDQPQLIKLNYESYEGEEKHRCTGKTTAIVRLSVDYNIPIFTSGMQKSMFLEKTNSIYNHKNIRLISSKEMNLPQYRGVGTYLVDEYTVIPPELTGKTLIGFTQQAQKTT